MQAGLIIRIITSPLLPAITMDDLGRRLSAAGVLLVSISDSDVNASVLSFRANTEELGFALAGLFEKIGVAGGVGRAFRLELQADDAATSITDEAVRGIAVAAHGTLRTPVYIARRLLPAAAWKSERSMGWGQNGLMPPQKAPVLPYSASEALGLAIEIGQPLIILKTQLLGLNQAQAEKALSAVGGPDSGFVDVAAYAVGQPRPERCFAVLELSDVRRTPPARVLQVLEIEARRYGGRLGAGVFLSHVPLHSLLDALAVHIGLHAVPAQIIETHLTASARVPSPA